MLSKEILDYIKEKLSVVNDQDINDVPLTDGRSGAEVYSIKVKSRRNRLNGRHIIKICTTAGDRDENEAAKARQLYDYAPQFSNHLVKVEATGQVGGKDVIIYSQANNSQMHSVAFSNLDGVRIAKYARWALRDLLAVLNETVQIDGTAEDFYSSYSKLWRNYGKQVLKNLERLLSENPQVPLVLVFDCSKESLIFRDQLINYLCDLHLPSATRFVSLRARFSEALHQERKELESEHRWHFIEHFDATLVNVAQGCDMYLNTACKR